jgi:hypothetical protein
VGDEAGDPAGARGVRPFPDGKTFVPRPWGGDFGEYASFGGTRVPTSGEAWWELPEGRFVYWRGRVTSVADRGGSLGVAATYRNTPLRRLGNTLISPLVRLGLAGKRTYILTVPGRKSGRRHSTPVQLVIDNGERRLVAPYGEREWGRQYLRSDECR